MIARGDPAQFRLDAAPRLPSGAHLRSSRRRFRPRAHVHPTIPPPASTAKVRLEGSGTVPIAVPTRVCCGPAQVTDDRAEIDQWIDRDRVGQPTD